MYVTFDTSVYKSAHSSTYLVSIKMLYVLIVIGILGSVGNSKPLLAGQPGGPWNTEEIDIVRKKVLQYAHDYNPRLVYFKPTY